HAMTLSTVDRHGHPDSRVLILKDIDENGWYFASSSSSTKGEQLKDNPHVSLSCYWPIIGRQVRIRGKALEMNRNQSANDFMKRGTVAKAIALIEKQSQILESSAELEDAVAEKLNDLSNNPQLVSSAWTLYQGRAREVEFWQAHEDRKHIRLLHTADGDRWTKHTLWP